MKLKGSYFYTLRENAKDEDSISGNLLVRAGFMKKVSAGIYMYLPNGLRVLNNIKKPANHIYDKIILVSAKGSDVTYGEIISRIDVYVLISINFQLESSTLSHPWVKKKLVHIVIIVEDIMAVLIATLNFLCLDNQSIIESSLYPINAAPKNKSCHSKAASWIYLLK